MPMNTAPAAVPISEPSDTYLVIAIVPKKNGAASSTASGWMKSAAPMPVATPRPPWKRRNTDAHAPTTAATPVSATASGEAPSRDATATGTKPLSTSSVATRDGAARAHRAQRVRAAGPAAADGSGIDGTGQSRDKDAHRQGARQVAQARQNRASINGCGNTPGSIAAQRLRQPGFLRRCGGPRTIGRDDPRLPIGRLSVAVGSSNSFDLIVLGGGTGGYSAAFRAGQLGLKVALVDDQPKLGGTCLHWGCIPTKAMLESAETLRAHPARRRLRHRRRGRAARLRRGRQAPPAASSTGWPRASTSLVKKNKVEHIRGRGTLQGGKKVRVETLNEEGKPDGERVLDANDVILATGSRVKSLPGLEPDGQRIITSDEATTSDTLPESIIVVGGGAVGVEFASFYHDAGVEVTLLEYLDRAHAARGRRDLEGARALVHGAAA